MPRPRILVNCSLNDHEAATRLLVAYCDPVVAAGGLPLILPALTDAAVLDDALDDADGVLLIGGPDYHPDVYGGHPQPEADLMDRRRHDADLLLAAAVLRRRLPVLGICGGHQLLAIARGGALVQDIPSEWPQPIIHSVPGDDPCFHPITVTAGSRLHALVGTTTVEVNSFHHQAVRPDRLGGLEVGALASDGMIEAIEDPAHPFLIGVQWHPERLATSGHSRALFRGLVAAAAA